MMGSAKNAVLYLRRSTEKQEQSIDDQRSAILAHAEREGYTVLREYVDDAISGADTARREAFHQMVEDARSGEFKTVLVYDISRFSRDEPDEAGYWRHTLRDRGVEVVYVADTIPDGDEGDLVLSVSQWTKHQYLIHLSRDTLRGAVSVARKGFSAGKPAPYGYRRLAIDHTTGSQRVLERKQQASGSERVKLIPDDDERGVVREIYESFVGRGSYRTIAQALNERGVPAPRGGRWVSSTIRDLLLNPAYSGDAVYNRHTYGKFYGVREGMPVRRDRRERGHLRHNGPEEWIVARDAHEAIVPRELWEQAQRRITGADRTGGPLREYRTSPHLLSGMIYCGACGHKMHGITLSKREKNGTVYKYRRYACSSAMTGRLKDHQNAVRADQLERLVVEEIEGFYKSADVLEVAEAMLREEMAVKAARASRQEPAQRRLAEIEQALATANRRIVMLPDDDLVAGVVAEVKRLREERERLQAAVTAKREMEPPDRASVEELASEMRDFGRHLRETYEDGSVEEKRAFLRESLGGPSGGIGPIVLNFRPAENTERRHGEITGGALYVQPVSAHFHRLRGGGGRIRTDG